MIRRALLVAVVALAACGGDDGGDGPLAGAERAMADLDAGRIDLQLSASAGGDEPTGPVGFRVVGPFSFDGEGNAVLDLEYTRLLGSEEAVTQVVSTGDAVYVVTEGDVVEVPAEQASALRLGDGSGGIADLGVAGWVREPSVVDGTVTGEVDVADFLTDLARVGAQVSGDVDVAPLEGDAAERLAALAQSSEAEIVLGDDDLPSSIRIVVDFGSEVPPELQDALGPYASARLELSVALERLDEPLTVEAPTG